MNGTPELSNNMATMTSINSKPPSKRPTLSFTAKMPQTPKTATQIAIDKCLEDRASARLNTLLTQEPVAAGLGSDTAAQEVKDSTFVEFISRNRKRIGVRKGPVIDYSKDLSTDDEKTADDDTVQDDCPI